MKIRNRVRELRIVKAGDLAPNPANWRTHPPGQRDALRGLLAEVGYADALIARELPDGALQLIDGHLRAETTPDAEVPVLVVDLDDAEAAKVLATLDPLGAMAGADAAKLDALLRDVETGSEALSEMLAHAAAQVGLYHGEGTPVDDPAGEWQGMPEFEHEDKTDGAAFTIRIFLKDEAELEELGRLLGKDLKGRKFAWFSKKPIGQTYEAVGES